MLHECRQPPSELADQGMVVGERSKLSGALVEKLQGGVQAVAVHVVTHLAQQARLVDGMTHRMSTCMHTCMSHSLTGAPLVGGCWLICLRQLRNAKELHCSGSELPQNTCSEHV